MRRALALVLALGGCAGDTDPLPFAARVVSFEPGPGAGFGQDALPDVVLGPPRGGGDAMGSLDVVSLGREGVIVLELGVDAVDGPGADLIVFENAFRATGGELFAEPGHLAVSADGARFVELPCDPRAAPWQGCVGVGIVPPDVDPTDPAVAGGDAFDLAGVDLPFVRYVRVRDAGTGPRFGGGTDGLDLDAVAVVHPR